MRLLPAFDYGIRPAFGGLSLLFPALGEDTVALWQRS